MTEQELQELIWYGQGDSEPEKALQWLNDTIQAQLEYESEHEDSGQNYAEIVSESWQYHNIDDSIWNHCLSKPEVFGALDGLVDWDIGERVEVALYMRPFWSEYHAFMPDGGLCLMQVPLSEVEIQITQYEAESKGHVWETIKRVAPYTESYLGNTYEDSLLFYATPGTSWCAVIEDSMLADILDNLREAKA